MLSPDVYPGAFSTEIFAPFANPLELDIFSDMTAQLDSADQGHYQEIFSSAVSSFRNLYPQLDATGLIGRLNELLFFMPETRSFSLHNAGPITVWTDSRAESPTNESGIVATYSYDPTPLTWEEGMHVFVIANHLESVAGGIVRNLDKPQKIAFVKLLAQIIAQQRAAGLFAPTPFWNQRNKSQTAAERWRQETDLLSQFIVPLTSCENPAQVVRDLIDQAERIAHAEPDGMALLFTDTCDRLKGRYADLNHAVIPNVVTGALNVASNSNDFTCVKTSDPRVALIRDARLAWRRNPHGNFCVHSMHGGDGFLEFMASRVSLILQLMLCDAALMLKQESLSPNFLDAVMRSITFVAAGLKKS